MIQLVKSGSLWLTLFPTTRGLVNIAISFVTWPLLLIITTKVILVFPAAAIEKYSIGFGKSCQFMRGHFIPAMFSILLTSIPNIVLHFSTEKLLFITEDYFTQAFLISILSLGRMYLAVPYLAVAAYLYQQIVMIQEE